MTTAASAVVAVPATAGRDESHQAGADQQRRNSPFNGHEKYLLVPGEFARNALTRLQIALAVPAEFPEAFRRRERLPTAQMSFSVGSGDPL